MPLETPILEQKLSPRAALERPGPSLGADAPFAGATPAALATPEDRDAILRALYDERRAILQAKRLGRAAELDDQRLADIQDYIAFWEAADDREQRSDEIWMKLDAIAGRVLGVQAEIERSKQRR